MAGPRPPVLLTRVVDYGREEMWATTAFQLRPGGLAAMRSEFDVQRKFYKEKVQPIRHKVYAHAARITTEEREALFTAVFMRPLEQLIVYTLRLERTLFQLYHNGREPVLDAAISNIAEVVGNRPEKDTSSWEHLHAAKDASAFLDWIKQAPLDE